MKNIINVLLVSLAYTSVSFAQEFVQNTIPVSNSSTTTFADTESQSWSRVDSVFLYGGGKLLSLVTSDTESGESTSPTGSLGLNFNTSHLTCNLFFSYNAKQEISMNSLSDFGSTLINPDRSGQSFTFSVKARLKGNVGLSGSFNVVDQDWKLSDTEKLDASPIVTKVGFYYRPFDFSFKDNVVDFTLDLHYTNRVISGDFGNASRMIDNTSIKRRGYNGWDIQANMRFNAVKFFVQFSGNKVADLDIPGFSGNQVLFGIEVTGKLVKVK